MNAAMHRSAAVDEAAGWRTEPQEVAGICGQDAGCCFLRVCRNEFAGGVVDDSGLVVTFALDSEMAVPVMQDLVCCACPIIISWPVGRVARIE